MSTLLLLFCVPLPRHAVVPLWSLADVSVYIHVCVCVCVCECCYIFLYALVIQRWALTRRELSSRAEADVGEASAPPHLHRPTYDYPSVSISQRGSYLRASEGSADHMEGRGLADMYNCSIPPLLKCLVAPAVSSAFALWSLPSLWGIFIPTVSSYIWIWHWGPTLPHGLCRPLDAGLGSEYVDSGRRGLCWVGCE